MIVQDRILSELRQIQLKNDMGMVYISHDISLVENVCDTVGVMYAGQLVEFGPVEDVFTNPIHPYTRGLIDEAGPQPLEREYEYLLDTLAGK